ncbi:MAG: AI-2E family transporter [Pseudomonadales bacterium]|jgi:predicted PurR-regulated permease PerM|nr:AI-2E family transporter [Pseudomonadales bacterium]
MLDKSTLALIKKTTWIVIVVLVLAILALSAWRLQNILILVFLAYLLMLALQGPINIFQKWLRLPRAGANVLAYVLFLVVVLGSIGLLAPIVVGQIYELVLRLNIPAFANELREIDLTLSELSVLLGNMGGSIDSIFSVLSSIFGGFLNIFALLVISFHMSMDHENLYKKTFWITNDGRKIRKVKEFIKVLEKQLGGWIRGEAMLMILVGVISYIGFSLIGIEYALPLAILAGMLELLPSIGPVIAAIPAIAMALIFLGPIPAVITIAFCVIVQQLENALLVPKIMKVTAKVNPLISILSIMIGYVLLGVAGALLAIPAYITLRAIYSFWLRDKLVKPVSTTTN